jgi:hypothetical protein
MPFIREGENSPYRGSCRNIVAAPKTLPIDIEKSWMGADRYSSESFFRQLYVTKLSGCESPKISIEKKRLISALYRNVLCNKGAVSVCTDASSVKR